MVHRALLDEHQPFRDVVLHRMLPDGTSRYVSVSGAPLFNGSNQFVGYRGIGKDITEQKRREEELLRFRAAIDASPDMVYLTDPATIRFLYVNEAACRSAGYTHE